MINRYIMLLLLFLSSSSLSAQWQRTEEIKMMNITNRTKEKSSVLSVAGTDTLQSLSVAFFGKHRRLFCYGTTAHPDSVKCIYTTSSREPSIVMPQQTKVIVVDSVHGQHGVDLRSVRNKKAAVHHLFLFNKQDTLHASMFLQEQKHWSSFNPIGSASLGVSGLFLVRSQLQAYYCEMNNNGSLSDLGVVLVVKSDDGGVKWSQPAVAVKHNREHFQHASIALYSKKKDDVYIAILTTPRRTAYYSICSNQKWSYPQQFPSYFDGINHKIFIFGDNVYLFFEQKRDDPHVLSSLFLWKGDIKDLSGDGRSRNNTIYKVADNYHVTEERSDILVDMIALSGNKKHIVLGNKWDLGEKSLFKTIELLLE